MIKINRFLLEDEEECKKAYTSVSFTGAICTTGIVPEATDVDQYETPQNAVSKVNFEKSHKNIWLTLFAST